MTVDALRIVGLDVLGIQNGSLPTMRTACSGPLIGLLDVAARRGEWVGVSGADIAISTSVAL